MQNHFRYFLEVSYDGVAFHGSQLQGEIATVQLAINRALSTLMRKEIVSFGASRTDEGVHALGNIYHFDSEVKLDAKFAYQLNAILPQTLSVVAMYAVAPESNSRFDAVSRRYRYRIYHKKNPFLFQRALYYPFAFDKEILHQTAPILKEYTNFETFSKRNTQSYTFNCTIFQSYWEEEGDELHYVVEANRFLRGMVRALVGTQLKVAKGKISVEEFRRVIENKDCTAADFSVAGFGLYLEKVNYPEGYLNKVKIQK